MSELIIVDREGCEHKISASAGKSIMENIRDNGLDELLAICGGCCSCATCHVYVEPGATSLLPPMSEDEDALLDGSEHRTAMSRLSCQLKFDDTLSGLRLTIAPED